MKQDVDSILLANWYLIKCKINKSSYKKSMQAKKYLVNEVDKALNNRTNELVHIDKVSLTN